MPINKGNICLKCPKNYKTTISSSIKQNDKRDR